MRKSRAEIDYVEAANSLGRNGKQAERPRLTHVVWWWDGPCPRAKAALMMQESFLNLRAITTSSDVSHTAIAVRRVADEISARRADAGVLLVQSAGAATVHANRLNELRAVVATTADSLDAAMKSIKPNVLILEHLDHTLAQMSNMLTRFLRGGGTT